jgi:hypothetical protein
MSSTTERDATRADAETRLTELLRVRTVLWEDRDDPLVLSELISIQSEILAAERALGHVGDAPCL